MTGRPFLVHFETLKAAGVWISPDNVAAIEQGRQGDAPCVRVTLAGGAVEVVVVPPVDAAARDVVDAVARALAGHAPSTCRVY